MIKIVRYFFPLVSLVVCTLVAFGQKETDDSVEVSTQGKNAQSDELFFSAIQAKFHNDNKEAKSLFLQFADKRPEVSDADYELAKLEHADHNFNDAESYIRKAIKLDGVNKWYREEYAGILADRGDFEAAADVLAALCNDYPADRDYPEAASEYYAHAGEYDKAIQYIDIAVAKVGGDEDLSVRKVQLYLEENNADKAIETLEGLLANDKRNARYYKMLGELYDNNKMYDKAGALYERALTFLPGDPYIQMGLVNHYLKTGDSVNYQKSIKKVVLNTDLDEDTQLDMFRTYVQTLPNDSGQIRQYALPLMWQLAVQHPANAELYELYGIVNEVVGRADSAIWAFRKSVAIKPSEYKIWESLLELCADKQHADSLLKYSQQAIRYFPNQANLHYLNGIGHYYKKEYGPAASAINRAIMMVQDTNKTLLGEMYSVLGDVYHEDKKDNLSDEAYGTALKMQPDNASTLNNYSYYLSERGVRLDEAEKMSERSLELRPTEATFLDTYGWICYKRGEYEKAREKIAKAIELAGNKADGTLYDHLGNVYYKLKNVEKAVENWKIAKTKGVDDAFIDQKIGEGKLYE